MEESQPNAKPAVAREKRLLIAGGGYADIPLIRAGKDLGYHVITTGNRPEELGHRYSDEYHPADYSDPDAILRLARQLGISAICACCNDLSALSAAHVAEQMDLPGHDPLDVAQIIHHKDRYRQFATAYEIATPRALGFAGPDEALAGVAELSLPFIVKPVDLTGGKGMSTVRKSNEARAAIERAFAISRAKRIVMEEFVEGTRHGYSAFLMDGRVVFHFSDNEHYFLNPYLVSGASTPSVVPESVDQKLCAVSEKIAGLLSLRNGIFHVQFILRDGEPVIIEICRRAPGDLYIRFVELATGVNYPMWIVQSAAGLECSRIRHAKPKGYYTRHCVMSATSGCVKDIVFDPSISRNVIERFMWWEPGCTITDVMTDKLGIVFLRFQSQEEMLDKTDRMQNLIRVVTE